MLSQPTKDELITPTGTVAGVRIGDEFKIFNVRHNWKGVPCHSELVFSEKTTKEPIAIATVVQVATHASLLHIMSRSGAEEIEDGAIVQTKFLPLAKKEKKRTLLRSIRIGELSSGKLLFEDPKNGARTEIDILGFMGVQMKELFNRFGFYVRK